MISRLSAAAAAKIYSSVISILGPVSHPVSSPSPPSTPPPDTFRSLTYTPGDRATITVSSVPCLPADFRSTRPRCSSSTATPEPLSATFRQLPVSFLSSRLHSNQNTSPSLHGRLCLASIDASKLRQVHRLSTHRQSIPFFAVFARQERLRSVHCQQRHHAVFSPAAARRCPSTA